MDELIARLRKRVADPERRVDARTNAFSEQVQSMSIGDLFGALRTASADLQRIVASNRAGERPDADLVAKTDQLAAAMSTPGAVAPLRQPADEESLRRAEDALERPLPVELRAVYAGVADGGFGPGGGLYPLDALVGEYRSLTAEPAGPGDQPWPSNLLPLVDMEPGYDCIDLHDGRIVAFDPESIGDGESDADWLAGFGEVAPSLETYLYEWLERPTSEERARAAMQESMVEHARAARAAIAAMTPAERAEMGLPEVGWERVVWGGIGLDEE